MESDFAGRELLNLKKVKYPKEHYTVLDVADSLDKILSWKKSRKVQSEETIHCKHTYDNKTQLKAESGRIIRKKNLYSLSRYLQVKETPESDELLAEDSSNEYFIYRPTELITKNLNVMLRIANSKIEKHNGLLNRFYKCFHQCFRVDEEYLLSDELEKDYLLPEELLLKPDLDFEKLKELPFDFRTSLVEIRSLVKRMNDCRQKCGGQLEVILNVLNREINRMLLKDKTSLSTRYYRELKKELKLMKLLLRQFCESADCCNFHLEEMFMDVMLIRKDFLV